MAQQGVYFLANDRVLDLAIAFLNSFRVHNPTIKLCLIPYSDDIAQLTLLRERYGFTLWQDVDTLHWCDDVSRKLHGRAVGQYRKLVIWEGSFEQFIYIDCDTVVLHNIEFAFSHLDAFDFVASHSNIPQIRRWVWKDSIFAAGALTEDQIAYAANTGFLVSSKKSLARAQVEARLSGAVALAQHMELDCCEQPLINYLIVTSSLRYASLLTIAQKARPWNSRMPLELWAGTPGIVVRGGRVIQPHSPVLMMHWAGEWQKAAEEGRQLPYYQLWSYYRYLAGSD